MAIFEKCKSGAHAPLESEGFAITSFIKIIKHLEGRDVIKFENPKGRRTQ